MMWSDINKKMDEPPKPRHPEAPAPGDEVMYVDLSREKLEKMYEGDLCTPLFLCYNTKENPYARIT